MQQPSTDARRSQRADAAARRQMIQLIGTQVVRFQDESAAFDDVAAQILALHRSDLTCMTMLLFGGAASVDQLTAALHVRRGAITATVERLSSPVMHGADPGSMRLPSSSPSMRASGSSESGNRCVKRAAGCSERIRHRISR
jgi:hypothetical protein